MNHDMDDFELDQFLADCKAEYETKPPVPSRASPAPAPIPAPIPSPSTAPEPYAPVKTNKNRTIKPIIILVIALAIALIVVGIAAVFFGYRFYQADKSEKAAEAERLAYETTVNEYISDMQKIAIEVTFGADLCMKDAENLLQSESAFSSYQKTDSHIGIVETLISYCDEIDEIMAKWETPPEGYEQDYENISVACRDFKYMCQQIIDPLHSQNLFYLIFIDAASASSESYNKYLQPYADSWVETAQSLIDEAEDELSSTGR